MRVKCINKYASIPYIHYVSNNSKACTKLNET